MRSPTPAIALTVALLTLSAAAEAQTLRLPPFFELSGNWQSPPPTLTQQVWTVFRVGELSDSTTGNRTLAETMPGRKTLSFSLRSVENRPEGLVFHYDGAYSDALLFGSKTRFNLGDPNTLVDDYQIYDFTCHEIPLYAPISGTMTLSRNAVTGFLQGFEVAFTGAAPNPPNIQWPTQASITDMDSNIWTYDVPQFGGQGLGTVMNVLAGWNGPNHVPAMPDQIPCQFRANQSGFSLFRRAAGRPFEIKTVIRGRVISPEGNIAAGPGAKVKLFAQKAGRIPALAPPATFSEWEETHRSELVFLAEAKIDSGGSFVFRDVDQYQTVRTPSGQTRRPLQFALVTSGVSEVDSMGQRTIYLDDVFVNNIAGPDSGLVRTYLLSPDILLSEKRRLSERLSAIGKINYDPTERSVRNYLDQLVGGFIPLTPERREGLARGVWAERIIFEGAQVASDLLNVALDRLATVLTDLYDEIAAKPSKQLKAAQDRQAKLNQARDRLSGTDKDAFNAWVEAANKSDALHAKQQKLLRKSAAASLAKKVIKLTSPTFVNGLTNLGMDKSTAVAVNNVVGAIIGALLDIIISDGTTTAVNKKVIELLVKATQPILLDDRIDIPLGPLSASLDTLTRISYTARTRHVLDWASASMQEWTFDNSAIYDSDIGHAVGALQLITGGWVDRSIRAEYAKAFTETLDTSEAALELGAAIYPPLGTAGKVSKISRFVTNTAFAVEPLYHVFHTLPKDVSQGVANAFGGLSIPEPVGLRFVDCTGGRLPEASLSVVDDRAASFVLELRRIAAQLRANDVGGAMDALWTTGSAHDAAEDAFFEAIDQVLLLAGTVESANPRTDGNHFGLLLGEALEWRDASSRAFDLAADLIIDVYAATYAGGVMDPAYVALRDRVVARFETLASAIELRRFDWGEFTDTLALGTVCGSALSIEVLELQSSSTGLGFVSADDETFNLTLGLSNLGSNAIEDLSLALVTLPANGRITSTSSVAMVPTLAAGATTTIDFILNVDGSTPSEVIGQFVIQALEDGRAPEHFVADEPIVVLHADPTRADTDGDGLPNVYEESVGLNAAADDADLDSDQDGLSNRLEHLLGTHPNESDTDGDGLDDREERTSGVDGLITDPLAADTDGDGENDAVDPAPLLPLESVDFVPDIGEPVIELETETVRLTAMEPVDVIRVSNAGSGSLLYTAVSLAPELVVTTAVSSSVAQPLVISARPDLDFTSFTEIQTEVVVIDVSGAEVDLRVIEVSLVGTQVPAGPYSPDGSVDGGLPETGPSLDDAGTQPGADASTNDNFDAGTHDAAPPNSNADEGCGCSSSEPEPMSSLALLFTSIIALALRRRKV